MLPPKMSRHYVGAKHIFSTNEQQKVCWQPKKWWMILHFHKKNMSEDLLLPFMHKATGAWHTHDFLHFMSIPKKIIVLISSKRCGVVGVGLGALVKRKMKLTRKKNTFSRSNYNWVSCGFGYQKGDDMAAAAAKLWQQTRWQRCRGRQVCIWKSC
jgi:hypothetical protein